MTEYIPDFVLNFEFNSWLALMLYWIPLLFCLIYSSHRVHKDIRYDIAQRAKESYYGPKVTIGYLLLTILSIIVPVVNLLYAVFTTVPGVLARLFDIIGDILNTPIIPRKK